MLPQHIHCIYKSLTSPPQRTTHFSLLFFPSPVCLARCTALLPRCCVIQWLPFSSMAPEWPMVIWMIETLRPCYCCFIGNRPIHITPWCCAVAYDCSYGPLHVWSASWSVTLSFWLLLLALPSYLGFPLRTSGCSAALLWSFISKHHEFFFSQASNSLHGKWNFLVIQHPGLAVNWMVPLPLHSCLLTPPGSIHLYIIAMFSSQWWNYCILFNSACLTCEVWRCYTQMWLVQGTGSQPPGVTSRWK